MLNVKNTAKAIVHFKPGGSPCQAWHDMCFQPFGGIDFESLRTMSARTARPIVRQSNNPTFIKLILRATELDAWRLILVYSGATGDVGTFQNESSTDQNYQVTSSSQLLPPRGRVRARAKRS